MRLKKFTHTKAIQNLISKRPEVKGFLFPDGRFTNGFLWLELPKEAVDKAQAKADKLNLETKDLPSLGKAIIRYRQGQPTEAQLARFYYDGMGYDQKEHRWYAEFMANGMIYSYNADHILALEYAAGIIEDTTVKDGTTITTKRPNIDKWLIFTEAKSPVLEAWNGHCVGGVFPLIRNTPDERHYKPVEEITRSYYQQDAKRRL